MQLLSYLNDIVLKGWAGGVDGLSGDKFNKGSYCTFIIIRELHAPFTGAQDVVIMLEILEHYVNDVLVLFCSMYHVPLSSIIYL